MPWFSNFPRNTNINYFRMCLYLVTCFLTVAVSLLCRSKCRRIRLPSLIIRLGLIGTCIFDTACNLHITKPWPWRNMSPNIQKFENRWSYFPENVWILALNSLVLTWFVSPNLSICFNFVRCCGPLWYNHIKRFSAHSRFIEKSMYTEQYLYYVLLTQKGALLMNTIVL